MNKILFVAPHPDDETLGCGGTILKHKDAGHEIYWLILTQANQKLSDLEDFVSFQKDYISKAAKSYGFKDYVQLHFTEIELDKYPFVDIVDSIKKVFDHIKPNIIYVQNRSDVQSDHRLLFDAVYACTKNFRAPYLKKILMYETLSETEFVPALQNNAFVPNVFVDITEYLERKLEIMRLFSTETMSDPYPRSDHAIRGLASYRGSRVGVKYAEAFMLLLEIL